MNLPRIDNDFLSLFLPDNSDFNKTELIEEFEIYIFKRGKTEDRYV